MPQIWRPGHWLFIVQRVSSGSWQMLPSTTIVSTSFDWTHRWPSGQSTDDLHWLWHRLKAHTSGLLQSELIEQPWATPAGAVASSPPHAAASAATKTIKAEK